MMLLCVFAQLHTRLNGGLSLSFLMHVINERVECNLIKSWKQNMLLKFKVCFEEEEEEEKTKTKQ